MSSAAHPVAAPTPPAPSPPHPECSSISSSITSFCNRTEHCCALRNGNKAPAHTQRQPPANWNMTGVALCTVGALTLVSVGIVAWSGGAWGEESVGAGVQGARVSLTLLPDKEDLLQGRGGGISMDASDRLSMAGSRSGSIEGQQGLGWEEDQEATRGGQQQVGEGIWWQDSQKIQQVCCLLCTSRSIYQRSLIPRIPCNNCPTRIHSTPFVRAWSFDSHRC